VKLVPIESYIDLISEEKSFFVLVLDWNMKNISWYCFMTGHIQ